MDWMSSGGHITDASNTRMKETSRRQRRMEASSEGDQGPEGAVAPWMDWWVGGWMDKCCYTLVQTLDIQGQFKRLRGFTSSIRTHIFIN